MRESRNSRPTEQKLAIFEDCFTGLKHVYGTFDRDTGRARQVKRPVTQEVLLRHIRGFEPYGVYLLVGGETRAIVADFDELNPEPPHRFVRQAAHYGLPAYLERSKSKGWHAWIFTEVPGVSAAKARLVVKAVLEEIDAPLTEVFPKQDRLGDSTRYGNFIHAPLFGAIVPEDRTVFVDPERGFQAYADQWGLLANVRRVSANQLDEIIEINELEHGGPAGSQGKELTDSVETRPTFGLPPCARRMLTEGVQQCQRVACFRLAVHLKKSGIPEDVAVAGLMAWASKNRPDDGKRIITETEIIEQTACAYDREYRACGCEEPAVAPYCEPGCPVNGRGMNSCSDGRRTG